MDNSDFSTPPDGQMGAVRMFLWDLTNPERDGAIENDIVLMKLRMNFKPNDPVPADG